MDLYSANIEKLSRKFIPADFVLKEWNDVAPYFKQLEAAEINSIQELENWLLQLSELEAMINEDACWRQIKMTCDTTDKSLEASYNYFCKEIQPHLQQHADILNKKLIAHPLTKELDQKKYFTYLRNIKNSIELYREDNVPINSELSVMQQRYGVICGKMEVTINGKEYTLQQAAKFLESPDRNTREEAYKKIQERRLQDKEPLENLFNDMLAKRNQIAVNAGFNTYTDFRFKELGRFDYTKENCYAFHEAVKEYVVPLVKEIHQHKKEKLQVDDLRPWDLDAEPTGIKPLTPFATGNELLQKSIACFTKLRPFFGDCLVKMNELKHLDLESRKGKAPGGYNCPLAESGAPFIFMNAAGQMNDVTTMVHEGGHAIHSFLAHPLQLNKISDLNKL